MKKLSDLRRARGLIQQAYSKIINRFGPQSEVLDMLTEALALMKAADVPGGVVEVEAVPAASSPQPEPPAEAPAPSAAEEEAQPAPKKRTKRTGKGK